MIKLYPIDPAAPVNGITWEGQQFRPDATGALEVPPEALEAAMAFGLTPDAPEGATEPAGNQPEGNQQDQDQAPELQAILDKLPNKTALVAYALEHYGLTLDPDMKRDAMEAAVLEAAAKAAEGTQE